MPRYARRTREVDEALLGTYLSGANSRRIRKALKPLLGEEHLSKSAVSRVVSRAEGALRGMAEPCSQRGGLRDRLPGRLPPESADGETCDQRTRTGRARGRARRAETSVVIASGGERSLDALGLRAGGTPGSRTPGSQASDQQRRPVQKHKRTQDWRAGPFRSSSTCGEPQFGGVSEAMSAIRVPRTRRENTVQQRGATLPGGDLDPGSGRTWTRTC